MSERIKKPGLEKGKDANPPVEDTFDDDIYEDLAEGLQDQLNRIYENQKGKGGGGSKKGRKRKGRAIETAIRNSIENREAQNLNNLKNHLDKLLRYFYNHENSKKNSKNIDILLDKYKNWLKEILLSVDKKIDIGNELKQGNISINAELASRPGGQNVNKRKTSITIIHEVTGVIVENQESRKQIENRENATERLAEELQKILDLWLAYIPNSDKITDEEFQEYFDKIMVEFIL